jgi:hypothetical protein
MSDTLGSLRAEILLELRGDLAQPKDVPLVNAKINNALANIWMSMMQAQLARLLGADSPVTFTLPAGAERVQLVSIPDPAVATTLQNQAEGTLAARNVTIGYTLVTESGSETQMSPVVQQAFGADVQIIVVAPAQVANAFGWNCYAAVAPFGSQSSTLTMVLQNQQPLPFSQNYLEPLNGFLNYPQGDQQPPVVQSATGATPVGSPPPSENTTGDNIAWIKHLEIRTSDTVLRSWNQYDIDSAITRSFASTVASSSEYQHYVWDLVNGNRIEVRPAAGSTFNPRYFYISKPRRLRYDQAEIPYVEIVGVHEFLTNQAIADLKLSLDEYLSSTAYSTKAGAIKMDIVKSLRQEDWAKNTRVQPHLY